MTGCVVFQACIITVTKPAQFEIKTSKVLLPGSSDLFDLKQQMLMPRTEILAKVPKAQTGPS